jgi:hypothetical protein
MRPWQKSAANIALMQAGWFSCVLGAAHGGGLAGPAAVVVLTALHLRILSRNPRREGLLIASAAFFGFFLETALTAAGAHRPYGGHLPFPLAPLWMTALWANFATLLDHSLGWLRGRPVTAALAGAAGGPAAYLGGEGLGAVAINGTWGTALLAAAWGAALPLLIAAWKRFLPPEGD